MESQYAPHWWSWRDIIEHVDQLGIPNFQRGAVWSRSNQVALLESIYEQSPCGSFVIWAPENEGDPYQHGGPLRRFTESKSPIWLVDGQQRTRATLGIFEDLITPFKRSDEWSLIRHQDLEEFVQLAEKFNNQKVDIQEDCEDEIEMDVEADSGTEKIEFNKDRAIWMVVLPSMRVFDRNQNYFEEYSESRKIQRSSMFRHLMPASRTMIVNGEARLSPPSSVPIGCIPLVSLISSITIFSNTTTRTLAQTALDSLKTDTPDLSTLDELIPWGPQFLTGYAYECARNNETPAIPIKWQHIYKRRKEAQGNGRRIEDMIHKLAGLFTEEWKFVFDRFGSMFTGNRFAVGWLPKSDISEAINAYVRINRAGIRVRSDERALALLSRARPEVLSDLAIFVAKRDGREAINSFQGQRQLLAHESDRQMGFNLWMTTVTRYTTLALLGTSARRWLDLYAIDKTTFTYRLDRVGEHETESGKSSWARPDYESSNHLINECTRRATQVLLFIDDVLSNELYLDHRMARQGNRTLTPIIDLLYRIPDDYLATIKEESGFRSAIAVLLRWTMLSRYLTQPELESFIDLIHGDKRGSRLAVWDDDIKIQIKNHFRIYQESLLKLNSDSGAGLDDSSVRIKLNKMSKRKFNEYTQNTYSLQNPTMGWLYALERRSGAKEFLWESQFEKYETSGGKVGIKDPQGDTPIEEMLRFYNNEKEQSLYPEKQHIIPFSIAREILETKGTRASNSDANKIGNITWLSHRQNALDGLSDRWTVMDRVKDHDNLAARGMLTQLDDPNGMDTLNLYEQIRDMVLNNTWRTNQQEAKKLIKNFCESRRCWMVSQMDQWLNEPLSPEAQAWLDV